MKEDVRVLAGGKTAFEEILAQIEKAKESILVNIYIWRDDKIGRAIGDAMLRAADRGVKIVIRKDRCGALNEFSEENQRSFFHDTLSIRERILVRGLSLLYDRELFLRPLHVQRCGQFEAMRVHPNIRILAQDVRNDHSKYYIFDRRTLIMGGVNIEDKENGSDRQGRPYHDYMVLFEGEKYMADFLRSQSVERSEVFVRNLKEPVRRFELQEAMLDLIRSAQKELTVLMAYFSPQEDFIDEILAAGKRGVSVRIVMPENANYIDASNKKTLRILYEAGLPDIRLYLSGYMLHAKLLMNENRILVGSCNITKKAFKELDELDCVLPNDGGRAASDIREDVERVVSLARPVTDGSMIKGGRIKAFFESFLM